MSASYHVVDVKLENETSLKKQANVNKPLVCRRPIADLYIKAIVRVFQYHKASPGIFSIRS